MIWDQRQFPSSPLHALLCFLMNWNFISNLAGLHLHVTIFGAQCSVLVWSDLQSLTVELEQG